MHGGAAAWLTGSYDPELNLMYWGLGNPGPDFNREQRPGDNLYSDSVIALDADTGEVAVALPVSRPTTRTTTTRCRSRCWPTSSATGSS